MKYFVVLIGTLVLVCGCTRESQRPQSNVTIDYESFIHVAAINADMKGATHVETVLKDNGIPSTIEGSVAYGVSVPSNQKEKATRILKADSKKLGYWIKFP